MKNSDLVINNRKGILIACEGISGSGKSDSIVKIYNFLINMYLIKPDIVEWNSNNIIRKLIKILNRAGILTPGIFSMLQWISFFIDYFTKIMPVLNKNSVVIADRYVYTALTRDIANGGRGRISRIICSLVRKPDLLFFFDTHHDTCYERITRRGKALFHTNKKIKQNRLLKNKDLYYLKKLRNVYKMVLNEKKLIKQTNYILVKENSVDATEFIKMFINLKFSKSDLLNKVNFNAEESSLAEKAGDKKCAKY
jgi:dTMP kinase